MFQLPYTLLLLIAFQLLLIAFNQLNKWRFTEPFELLDFSAETNTKPPLGPVADLHAWQTQNTCRKRRKRKPALGTGTGFPGQDCDITKY